MATNNNEADHHDNLDSVPHLFESGDMDIQPTNSKSHSSEGDINTMEASVLRMLENQKREIMYELRRLRLGDRPVTGQGSKERLEEFFARELNQPTVNNAANVNNALGLRRPESVVVEVNALVERRPVSSVLESSAFRQSLENSLRSYIRRSTISNSVGIRTIRQSPPNSVPSNATNSPRQSSPDITEPPIPLVPTVGNGVVDSHDGASSETLVSSEWLDSQQVQAGNLEELIDQQQQETIIEEITELLHQHIVTATLSSDFRDELEELGNRHIQQTTGNGARVVEILRSLPRTARPRNDFSHLGIRHATTDNLDNVSIISATAAVAVPYAQSNASIVYEMQLIKTQLHELQTMMRLSFDMQLDIQRAIRQEVAAAVSSVTASSAAAVDSSQPPNSSKPVDDSNCIICLDRNADTVIYQCGHLCVCYGCGMMLKQRNAKCPVCRAPIRDIIRAFKTN